MQPTISLLGQRASATIFCNNLILDNDSLIVMLSAYGPSQEVRAFAQILYDRESPLLEIPGKKSNRISVGGPVSLIGKMDNGYSGLYILPGNQRRLIIGNNREECFCTAYRKGFSVVEITRIIGSKKADYAHSVLVKHRVINQGKRGRPAKDSIPPVLATYLSRRSLSFAKWCAGWEFDIWDAGHAIRENADGPVLDAVRRDFPGCYVKMRKLKEYPDYVHPPQCPSNKLEANVIWDNEELCYRAEKIENSTVRGYGLSMEDAIRNLKVSHNFGLMLVRLEAGCGQ